MKKQVIGVFLSLILSVLLISSVSAFWTELKNGDITGAFNSLQSSVSGINTAWSAQVLLFFLVLIVVFAISDYLPFFDRKTFLSFLFSLAVAILAVFYLRSEEIYSVLGSFKALGVVITAVIPFFVIAAISKKAHEEGHTMISKCLWIAFIVALLWILAVYDRSQGTFGWLYVVVLVAAVIMFFTENWLYFKLMKAQYQGDVTDSQGLLAARLTAKIQELDDELATTTSARAIARLESRRIQLVTQLNRVKSGP